MQTVYNSNELETLDTWLKFGTIFLFYRLFSYYLINPGTDTKLIHKSSLKLIIYILIGFSFYFIIVKPFVPLNNSSSVFNAVLEDTLKFGIALTTAHLLDAGLGYGKMFNEKWLRSTGLILFALAAYRVMVFPFIPLDNYNADKAGLITDLSQFSVVLLVHGLLQGRAITDQGWIISTLLILGGTTTYHLGVKKLFN